MLKILITVALLCSLAYAFPLSNDTGCGSIYEFKYPNGSCLPTCPSPYQANWEYNSYFCDAPCPDSYFNIEDESCVEDCDPEFIRFEDDILYCDQPSNNSNGCPENAQFLYYNGTCLPSCQYPFKSKWSDGSLLCVPNCTHYFFNFWTDRCINSCDSEYRRIENNILYCDQPPQSNNTNANGCPFQNDVKHINGSCLAECPDPFSIQVKGRSLFCISPCPGRYFDTWKKSCTGICKSEYVRNETGISFCDNPQPIKTKPCPYSRDFRYSNGSCLSSCFYPYKTRQENSHYFCDARCPGSYLNSQGADCLRFCEEEFIQFEDGVAYCDTSNNTSNGCPNPDDFRYLNGSCLPSCRYPFTSEWSYESLLCVPNCKYSYFNFWTERCLGSCDDEYIRAENGISYCDEPPKPNLANGCPFYSDFKWYNGSCSQNCPYPLQLEQIEGVYYCNLPCPAGKYYNPWNFTCRDTCRPDLIRNNSDVLVCNEDPYYTGPCPTSGWLIYPDRSCKPSCPSPYWVNYQNNSFYCNSPCPTGQYIYLNGSCVETCEREGFAVSVENGMVYCKETNCSIHSYPNGSKTTNCQDFSGHCPSGYFLFDDSSCNQICPAEFSAFENATCTFPCSLGSALYPDGRCLDSCTAGYTLRNAGNFMICDKDAADSDGVYSAKIEIYLRYDIPLKDFNAGGYLEKFITMMAKLLDVSDSDIKILSVREGSTIIESEVVLKSESLADTKSKANSINQKLVEAAESKDLNLEGVGVLNHKFSVVIPEQEESAGITNNDDKSSSKALAIGLGVGLAVVAVGIVTLVAYSRHQKKQKLLKVREQIQGKAKTVAETPIRRDEEICSFVHRGTENMSPQTIQPGAGQLSPRINIEPVVKEEGEEQVKNEGPMSMDEIMNNIDENL